MKNVYENIVQQIVCCYLFDNNKPNIINSYDFIIKLTSINRHKSYRFINIKKQVLKICRTLYCLVQIIIPHQGLIELYEITINLNVFLCINFYT